MHEKFLDCDINSRIYRTQLTSHLDRSKVSYAKGTLAKSLDYLLVITFATKNRSL